MFIEALHNFVRAQILNDSTLRGIFFCLQTSLLTNKAQCRPKLTTSLLVRLINFVYLP